MIWPFRKKDRVEKLPTRSWIFGSALLLCSLMGAIEMPLPLEGVFRGVRNELRARPADQSIIVAAYDERTIRAFGTDSFSRSYNASLLDSALAAGATKVYFNEAFSLPMDEAGDRAFAQAIARHPGKVFTGAMYFYTNKSGSREEILPAPIFRDVTQIRSLNGAITPFSLSAKVSYGDVFAGQAVPSLSADIAGRTGNIGQFYLPDWTIQAKSIPTISAIDLIQGQISPEVLRGKTVIVGNTTDLNDFVQVYGQGWFPGVYLHAIGAQTLKEGAPQDIGWVPPMIVAALLRLRTY